MIVFSVIPEDYLDELLRIDVRTNSNPWPVENLRSSYHQFQHLGLFEGTQLVAYLIFQQTHDEAEIIHFICDKPFQRQGLGYQLLNQWLTRLSKQSVKTFFLEVRESNLHARKLYEKIGFQPVGERPDYYANKETAIVMRLDNFSSKTLA